MGGGVGRDAPIAGNEPGNPAAPERGCNAFGGSGAEAGCCGAGAAALAFSPTGSSRSGSVIGVRGMGDGGVAGAAGACAGIDTRGGMGGAGFGFGATGVCLALACSSA